MVGLQNAGSIKVTLQDSTLEPIYIDVNDSKLINTIFTEVREKLAERSALIPEEIELLFRGDGKEITLSILKEKSLSEADLWPVSSSHELVIVPAKNITLYVSDVEDELHLGASASPTADTEVQEDDEAHKEQYEQYNKTRRRVAAIEPTPITENQSYNNNYVGLVNQAMTCYLNSLLQALYMTPEFRNALYNWEFDGASETRSIPYQLQKLFLNLQTSGKSAVETTDLTTSFGWQGSDAWHQHDIQELCRVMFDALEHKFKDTKQANLINDLYEGKMMDYVKCLECSTEKSREDTFLDIPLPVRPFGSTVAYNSVEEALRAFVQPETLDGNDQYFCEKCNKKCDAHKGLKFVKFPYLLTLHLKRFDFDYSTMHRIKLNDKVVFPERLNLNSFVLVKRDTDHGNDDCSTTDSGSADDESCQGTDLSSTVNGQDDNCADSDEGIDVSSGTTHHENEPKGPYIYELFSIMIHSGSASGGHYYAYIRDFDKNMWFCFNDQNVTSITEDDIMKTYGGGPQRAYYSGAYSSSTNAYMLMYRQIDKDRNCKAMGVSEFPAHIQKLLSNMRQKEEEERINRKKENDMIKVNVCCFHPGTRTLQELKIATFADSTMAEVAQHAYNRFKLDGLVDVKDCRMVTYNKQYECIDFSFDSDEITCQEAEVKYNLYIYKWMLEIREPGTEWKHYKKGGINVRVYFINLETLDIEEPKLVRLDIGETVGDLRNDLSTLLNITDPKVILTTYNFSTDHKYLNDDSEVIEFDSKWENYKLYVTSTDDKDVDRYLNTFQEAVELYSHVISLHVLLPETDEATLEALSIPSLDLNQNIDRSTNSPNAAGMSGDGYDQSNSEDSSLSDSDRTLIGDPPVDCVLETTSDQHMASPTDPCQDSYNYDVLGKPGEDNMVWEQAGDVLRREDPIIEYYFKIINVQEEAGSRLCKVLLDKRMNLETLKKHLECLMKVPSEYFKVYVQNVELDWSRLKDSMQSTDGERITLKLGRVLREDEQICKIYHLKPDSLDPNLLLFEHIITKNHTIEATKREFLRHAKKQGLFDLPYSRCRLREKLWKKPKKVFLDDQKFGDDISLPYNFEIYLQELTEPETITSSNQVVVFTRRFCPETVSLEPYKEIVLNLLTLDELRTKISELSKIPLEHLDVAHVKGNYPYDMHLLEIEDELDWNPKVENLGQWPLSADDGCMFFYRDNRQKVNLTPEEAKEIRHKEDVRLGRLTARTYSPGRERALKIYLLDSSPSKPEDDID